MSAALLLTMLVLPWGACLTLMRSAASDRGRLTVLLTALLISLGCLALVIGDAEPSLSFVTHVANEEDSTATLLKLAWSADRFSLVSVAATMLILAAAVVLLPDAAPAAWMLMLMVAGCLLQLWWLQQVWWMAGVTVMIAFLVLVISSADDSPRSAEHARSWWLSMTVGDLALIMALIAGVGGLGDGLVRRFQDVEGLREFAGMRPATAIFVGFWWWISILGRTGQFPLCVTFDRVRTFSPLAWVVTVGLGGFAVGWRWSELGHAWWAASPSVFNLIVRSALASVLLCAWFALCTADMRVRVAYLTGAQISLALGPLCTGTDVDRLWASAVVMGTLGLAVWCWCVVTAVDSTPENDPEARPSWSRIMTGGEGSAVVWQWSMSPRPTVPAVLPTMVPAARSVAPVIMLMWCGLSIAAGSWWWSDEPLAGAVETSALSDGAGAPVESIAPMRPNGSIPVSALAVAITAAAMSSGMRSLLRVSEKTERRVSANTASLALAVGPAGIILFCSRPAGAVVTIGSQYSLPLACLAFAALITGWVWAGWPIEQQQRAAQSFAAIQHLGERRLLIPGLLHFGANFPLRGLAQLFRFVDWSVLEIACWGRLRALPETVRGFNEELRDAGNGSYALVMWVSGTALITTIIWLAQTPH